MKSPEAIDPEETNPDTPWTASPVADIGCSNPIVARVLLQGHQMLDAAMFVGDVNKEAIIIQLHSCKESLAACEKIAKRVGSQIENIIRQFSEKGISTDKGGRALNPFPQVPELDSECGTFLIHANRTIKVICGLPKLFITLERADNNFDHLSKRLGKVVGENTPLTEFVKANTDGVRYLIDLRNFHEHPKEIKTVIDNFRLMPDGNIRVPMWHLSDKEPHPIKEEMVAAIKFLIQTAEAMLIHLVMHRVSKQLPYIVEEIPEEKIDAKNPIKYRLSFDLNKLKMA